MVKLKIENKDIPFVKYIALRDNLNYKIQASETEGSLELLVDIPKDQQNIFLKDIACEKQSAEFAGLPVYSYETLCDPDKYERLQKLNGTTSYLPLAEDQKKIEEEIWQM